jgi:hypothetical protein
MHPLRIVSNHIKAQGTLVAPLNPLFSHPSFDHARSFLLAIPPNRALEPSTMPSQPATLFSLSLSMLAKWLTPFAVLAGALAVWRLAADTGWTNQVFIANGLLSHWQAWFAVAIAAHTSARILNRWLKIQNSRVSIPATRDIEALRFNPVRAII